MRKSLPTFFFLLTTAACAFSQDPSPVPQPAVPADTDVVKITTNLIQLDVTVTDSDGKPIPDLKPDEVEIYENGKKQNISNFSFISNIRAAPAKSSLEQSKNTPLPPPPVIRPENIKRTIALVVDDLGLSFHDTWATREALKRFVKEQMQDGDLVAILRTGGGIGAAQQFTTDKRLLLAAIDKIQFNMIASTRASAFNPLESTLKEEMNGSRTLDGNSRNYDKNIQGDKDFENENNSFRESIFASGTLGAINYIIRGMKTLPGRKSLMLLSGGFSIGTRNPSADSTRIIDLLHRLTDLANRASVVIYTIDVRGLVFTGLTAADDTNGVSTDKLDSSVKDRQDELLDTQDGLRYLAKQTGGLAYIDQNFISTGIRRALDDQSYYLVGYEPDDATFDPKKARFNNIAVRVLRKGAKVRYRSGFFGFSDEQVDKVKASPNQALYDALTSPFAVNGIQLRMNALFTADASKAGSVRSFLHIESKDLSFTTEPNGHYKTVFDLIASTFGDNGALIDGIRKTYTLDLSEETYKQTQEHGIVYDFEFPVKKPGAYQLRVAIRDNVTNKVGSAYQFLEIPNIKKDRLALSGVLLENMDLETWKKIDAMPFEEAIKVVDPKGDTAIRRFLAGSVLSYSALVFNPKHDPAGKVSLTIQAKIFNEQNLVFEGKQVQREYAPEAAAQIDAKGTIRLAGNLPVGNYTLQFIVTDNNAEDKHKVANQFVPFEIIKLPPTGS